jgi:hypothetical protein
MLLSVSPGATTWTTGGAISPPRGEAAGAATDGTVDAVRVSGAVAAVDER